MQDAAEAQPAEAATMPWDCQACGACCDHDPSWPRFTLETDAEIEAIPGPLLAPDGSGMGCVGGGTRCAALAGDVGRAVTCTIYAVRPIVCRDCQPGDDACRTARSARGLPT